MCAGACREFRACNVFFKCDLSREQLKNVFNRVKQVAKRIANIRFDYNSKKKTEKTNKRTDAPNLRQSVRLLREKLQFPV